LVMLAYSLGPFPLVMGGVLAGILGGWRPLQRLKEIF
jgi:hypothetical protein